MGTLRWEKESAQRRAIEITEVESRLGRLRLDAEEAELQVRLKSVQTELMAKQVEKSLLRHTRQVRQAQTVQTRVRMRELRGADTGTSARK